jgi:hypothetical protein
VCAVLSPSLALTDRASTERMITYTTKFDHGEDGPCTVQIRYSTGGTHIVMRRFDTKDEADKWIATRTE